MSPSILTLLLHIGTIVTDVKDIEQLVADLFAKKPVGTDLQKLLSDLAALFTGGLAPLPPGMSKEEVSSAFQSLMVAFQPPVAAPAAP